MQTLGNRAQVDPLTPDSKCLAPMQTPDSTRTNPNRGRKYLTLNNKVCILLTSRYSSRKQACELHLWQHARLPFCLIICRSRSMVCARYLILNLNTSWFNSASKTTNPSLLRVGDQASGFAYTSGNSIDAQLISRLLTRIPVSRNLCTQDCFCCCSSLASSHEFDAPAN